MTAKTIIASLFTSLFLSANCLGQSDVEKIKNIILEFNKDISKLMSEGGAQADQMMSYTNQNFSYHAKTINIMNVVSKNNFNKKTVSFILHEMRSSNISAKRKVGSLDQIYVRDNLGLALFEVEYELYESDRLINKGVQFNQYIFRKNSKGDWLLEEMNVLNADDVTYKSKCVCEIYETKGLKNILTETIVPDGHQADILEDKFSIDESTQPRLVRHGFKDYWWDTNGSINRRNIDGTVGNKIGFAKSRQELLLTLLLKEVYPDRCSEMIRKLK